MRGCVSDDEDKKEDIPDKVKVYRNRTDYLISKMEDQDDDLDHEDHCIQFPWTPEKMPTPEEIRKRQEVRKEQG